MAIKSQKDFFSGLLFMAVGIAFAWGATNYSVGTGARMGPGYFPLILGICMAILGGIIIGLVEAFSGLSTKSSVSRVKRSRARRKLRENSF